jgi:anti-anti-sigma factor
LDDAGDADDPDAARDPEQPDLIRIETRADPGVVVIRAGGEVDSQTIPPLAGAVAEAVEAPGTRCVVLDLDGVVFFGSGGIAFLTRADSEARGRGVALRVVVRPDGRVYRVLDMMGLTRIVALYPTLAEALADPLG